MKKETKIAREIYVMGIVIIISGLIILIISGYFDAEFKITKEECWNESIDTGQKVLVEYTTYTLTQEITPHQGDTTYLCNYFYGDGFCSYFYEPFVLTPIRLYEEWDCSEYKVWWEGDIKKEERSERTCYRNLSLDSIEISNDLVYQKEQSNFPVYLEFIATEYFHDNIYEKKEVCDLVEVDRIKKNDGEWEFGGVCYDNHCAITREDLTIDWLDSECECINEELKECKKNEVCVGENPSVKVVCSKYKCNDYFVEVIK